MALGCSRAGTQPQTTRPGESPGTDPDPGASDPAASDDAGGSDEPFSKEAIDEEVQARLVDLRACYDARVQRRPELAGVVVATFVIGDDGRARDVQLRSDEIDDSELDGCLTGILETTEFPPAPRGEEISVTYPFDFRPE